MVGENYLLLRTTPWPVKQFLNQEATRMFNNTLFNYSTYNDNVQGMAFVIPIFSDYHLMNCTKYLTGHLRCTF